MSRRLLITMFVPTVLAAAYLGCESSDSSVANNNPGSDAAFVTDTSTNPIDSSAPDSNVADSAVAWTPAKLTGLVLWIDGRQGAPGDAGADAAATTVWKDLSPAANTVQTTGAVSLTSPGAGINGGAAIHFDGTDYLTVADSPSLQLGFDDVVIAEVVRHSTPTDAGWGYGMLYSKQNTAYPYTGAALVANTESLTGAVFAQLAYQQVGIATPGTSYNNGQPFYVSMRRFGASFLTDGGAGDASAATLALRINGSDAGVISGNTVALDLSAAGQAVHIGGTPANQNVVGDIAEVIVVRGASDADVAAIEGYLKTRYGL